ncbi:hypothetical protein WH52_01415 [Tenacibaculum holothuriorum]|uniref:Uncharacterized protein n=1 Tax=Tenacibaculum holothuriorum TaxID=1635173 RepID=A0A1Y2PFP6_9FLAO|nr:hypothetical protein [Tenacibaculum holothuriorum]OSY89326.1 hypothetical protein WH52_01415 [Tenacibaculum holothuriorum]
MKWYNYLAAFGAGFFLTNVIPHLVNGVSGQEFPSPFGAPPGVGLSSPIQNVIWALMNMVIGYLLYRVSKIDSKNIIGTILMFVGIAVCALMCANSFGSNPNL